MLIPGLWHLCDDGVARPIMLAEILDVRGRWVDVPLLVDTGADRTVLSNSVRDILGHTSATGKVLGGVGGETASELIETQIRLSRNDGGKATFQGEYAAFVQDEALDRRIALSHRKHGQPRFG